MQTEPYLIPQLYHYIMESNEELHATLEAIFRIDEKSAFRSEYENLQHEIESKGLGESRIFILVNFLLYKLYLLDEFNKRRLEVVNDPFVRDRIPNLYNKILTQFTDEYFFTHKKFLLDVLVDLIVSLEEFNEDLLRSVLYNQNDDIINYLLQKIKIKNETMNKIKFESRIVKDPSKSTYFETNNRDKGCASLGYKYSFYSNCSLQKSIRDGELKEYRCEISYLGGNDVRTQVLVVRSKEDYKAFLFHIKKKLDIYEHAKFKILICGKKPKQKVFRNIKQLKINRTNRLKIVPYDF
jgi:hypothetical protein